MKSGMMLLQVLTMLVALRPHPCSSQTTPRPAPRTTSQIAERAVPASVTVVALGASGDTISIGSGFFVRADGVVVTNHHVLAGATRVQVVRANGEILDRVGVLDTDPGTDIAILKATTIGMPVLILEPATPVVGQRVVVVGAPLGLQHTVSEGIVSAVRIEGGREQIQMSAPISPGSSGGPVIDASGRVVAVTRATLRAGQSLNFAIPARYVVALLADAAAAQPRSVAEVFGTPETAPSSRAGGSRESDESVALFVPPPAAPRRNALVGTFMARTEVRYASRNTTSLDTGIVVLSEEGAGFWILRYADDRVLLAYDAVATQTGRVGLKMGRIALEGWVTESGFYLSGEDPPDNLSLRMVAEPIDLPLADPIGTYDINVRTSYTAGNFRGDPTNWSGTAVVMTTADSIWIDISLRNAAGGSTGALAITRLSKDGSFNWQGQTKAASGFVRNGKIEIDWTDRREQNAVYRGLISGQRR